jgi:hypothetical protein
MGVKDVLQCDSLLFISLFAFLFTACYQLAAQCAGGYPLAPGAAGCGPDEATSAEDAHCAAPYSISGHIQVGYTHDDVGGNYPSGGNGFSFGHSFYVKVFRYLDMIPGHTTGQSGIFGQWIQDFNNDRPNPDDYTPMPWNSIEGGLFAQEKTGRHRYPVFMIGASTHMYNPNSDVSGGWGFFEQAIGCEFLSRVQLSNRVIVPPNHVQFDETQEQEGDGTELGNYFGASWAALPIFGGKNRTDSELGTHHPNFGDDEGELSWTFTIDSEQFSGPLVSFVPEHFFRQVELFNGLEDEEVWNEGGGAGPNGCCGELCYFGEEGPCEDWCIEAFNGECSSTRSFHNTSTRFFHNNLFLPYSR